MDYLLKLAFLLLPLLYFLVAGSYGGWFFLRNRLAGRLSTPAFHAVVALHLGYLILLTWRWGQFPVATVSQLLSVVALSVALVYLLVEWLGGDRSTGFWMVALVLFLQLLSFLLHRPEPPPAQEFFANPLVAGHVALALLGYTGFAVAAAYGFLFLELYGELKRGRFSTFFGKLPPLEVLERMMTGALWAGFLSLTVSVVLGAAWAQQRFEAWLTRPEVLLTLGTWGLYGVALLLRRMRRWQGRQTAFACLTGLAAILVSLLAVNLLFTGFHAFG